jgi:protein FAM32A
MTASEQKFKDIARKRLEEQADKLALKSHKDRVAEFNENLSKLSEHHDIPKIGPG